MIRMKIFFLLWHFVSFILFNFLFLHIQTFFLVNFIQFTHIGTFITALKTLIYTNNNCIFNFIFFILRIH